MNDNSKIQIIKKLGLSDEEINQYGETFLINYLKFHHNKYYRESSVIFLGFTKEEMKVLKKTATLFNLRVKLKISTNLNFVCIKHNFNNDKRLKKSKEYGAKILTENEFLGLFNEKEYKVFENELIYPTTIIEDLRIVIPLSNYNKNLDVESFSFSNENSYKTNLFEQTCSCNEFIENNKNEYEKGNLMRFCKHLISEYKQTFTPIKLSKIKTFLIENEYSLKNNFKKINIEKVASPIYLSYDNNNEWCDIYFPSKNSYERYGYNYKEERFSYNDKPHGNVATLRAELNKIFKKDKRANKKSAISNQNKGCASILFMFIIMACFIAFIIILA